MEKYVEINIGDLVYNNGIEYKSLSTYSPLRDNYNVMNIVAITPLKYMELMSSAQFDIEVIFLRRNQITKTRPHIIDFGSGI